MSIFNQMLARYDIITENDRKNAIYEVMQEITLGGLYRGGFFNKAAFYGGTCLRIFHGIDNYSEDMDFSLIEPDPNFKLEEYFPAIKNEFEAVGRDVEITKKDKKQQLVLFMKKTFTLLTLFCCFSLATQAQNKKGTYGLQVEAGYALAFSGATRPRAIDGELDEAWSIAVSPGYHVTDKLFAGVGVGVYNYGFNYNELSEGMLDIQSNFIAIPIYAHGMWNFRGNDKPSFFVSLKAGYSIISKSMYPMRGIGGLEDYENHYSGGLYVSPSIGFIYPLNYKNSLSLSVSYDLQQNKEELVDTRIGRPMGKEDRDNYTLAVKVGWGF